MEGWYGSPNTAFITHPPHLTKIHLQILLCLTWKKSKQKQKQNKKLKTLTSTFPPPTPPLDDFNPILIPPITFHQSHMHQWGLEEELNDCYRKKIPLVRSLHGYNRTQRQFFLHSHSRRSSHLEKHEAISKDLKGGTPSLGSSPSTPLAKDWTMEIKLHKKTLLTKNQQAMKTYAEASKEN